MVGPLQYLLSTGLSPSPLLTAQALSLWPESQEELGWLSGGPWMNIGAMVIVALVVLTVSGTLAKRKHGRTTAAWRGKKDFDLSVAKLESLPVSPIASASSGPVHFEGVLSSANETLGGPPERARVYHNRKGASRKAAVAAELVLLRDESGQVGLEGLEEARVIAAADPKGQTRHGAPESISLMLGDRVQVLGYFRAEMHGDDEKAADRVFGNLGNEGQIQVRLLERPEAEPPREDDRAEADAPALDSEV